MALVGESSNKADRLRYEGDFAVKLSTIDGLFFTDLRAVAGVLAGDRLALCLLSFTGLGEFNSGESEGNEVRDLSISAVVGVVWVVDMTDECLRALE